MATKAKKPSKSTAPRTAKAKKPAAKSAVKAKKPAVKPAVKAKKPAAKPTAKAKKPAAKPAVKPAAKPAEKPPAILEFERGTIAGSFSKAYVQSTQDMIHLHFQPDFLAFLEAHNGGIPKRRYFKMGSNQKVVDRFLSLVPNYKDDPLGAYDIGVVWSQIEDRLNDSLVPFAGLYAGDFLCFDYSGGGKPRVVFWDHERSDEDNPFIKPVADDFQQFLSMLTAE